MRKSPARIHVTLLRSFSEGAPKRTFVAAQKRGKATGIMRAVALLLSDEGPHGPAMKDADIQTHAGVFIRNLERLCLRCCEVGPLAALARKPRSTPGREVKITGEVEAYLARKNKSDGLRVWPWLLRLAATSLNHNPLRRDATTTLSASSAEINFTAH